VEEAFRHSIIPTISLPVHTALDSVGFQQCLKLIAGALNPSVGMMNQSRLIHPFLIAVFKASIASCRVIQRSMAQPMTFRWNKSNVTARYNQPPKVEA